jgi:hypothetical protein
MEDWSVSLGNTLLASIVCLLWYVFGLWEEKDKVSEEASLTSAAKKVRSVDKEENFNNGSTGHLCTSGTGGEGGHLYMLPEEGRHLLVEQAKQRQEEIQSMMQLKEEKAPIAAEEKKTTKTKSLDVRNQGPTTFQWPQNANVLVSARPTTSTVLSSALEHKLKDLGIFRTGGAAEGSNCQVEGAARRCGLELTKKQVRVSFDTFMAKSRPGLESDEEVKETSPKPKRKQGNKKNHNVKEKKTVEPVSRYEKKERKEKGTMIRTGGWSNPAWKMVQPQPSPALVRAF